MKYLILVVILAVSCSPPPERPTETDAGDTVTQPDSGEDDFPDIGNTDRDYPTQVSERITLLEFSDPPVSDLNGIIALNMSLDYEKPIVLFHRLSNIDATAGTLELSAGNLAKTGDGFQIGNPAPSSTSGVIDNASGRFQAVFEKFVFSGTIVVGEEIQEVAIPISQLDVTGVVGGDVESPSLSSGRWSGHITKADGDSTMVRFTPGAGEEPLTELFREDTLNFDTTTMSRVEAGTGDAWAIDAVFESTTVSF